MELSRDIRIGIQELNHNRFVETVSIERIREELDKMFKFDTEKSFQLIMELRSWNYGIFKFITDNLWFKPTTEKR